MWEDEVIGGTGRKRAPVFLPWLTYQGGAAVARHTKVEVVALSGAAAGDVLVAGSPV